ncbi:hypothetical protein SAMN02787142_7719 [Burkholderia sp. WP9]|nr:hypothetical protein SAMN02787142_7719 [Burkholderia sp. WP9]
MKSTLTAAVLLLIPLTRSGRRVTGDRAAFVSASGSLTCGTLVERKKPRRVVPGLSACRAAPCKPQALRV